MYPRILDINVPLTGMSIPIYSYGFMMMLGFSAGLYIARERARRESLDPSFIMDLGVALLLSGIIGARIAYIVEFREDFSWQIFNVGDGGWSAIGGLLGAGTGATLGYYLPVSSKRPAGAAGMIVSVIIGILAGARIVHVALNPKTYKGALDIFRINMGGLAFYGGFIAATAVGLWYIRKRTANAAVVADVVTPSIAVGLAFGRIGCFLNGCCFGTVTYSFVGIAFPGNSGARGSPAWYHHYELGRITFADPYSLPVHPTQLYHAAAALGIFVLLVLLYRARRAPGQVFLGFAVVYSMIRFFIEFLRDDMSRPLWGLTAYQILAIPVFLVCGILFARLPSGSETN